VLWPLAAAVCLRGLVVLRAQEAPFDFDRREGLNWSRIGNQMASSNTELNTIVELPQAWSGIEWIRVEHGRLPLRDCQARCHSPGAGRLALARWHRKSRGPAEIGFEIETIFVSLISSLSFLTTGAWYTSAMASFLIGVGLFIHEKRKAKKQAKREQQQHLEDQRAPNAQHHTALQSDGNGMSSSNRQYEDAPPSYEQAMASRSSLEAWRERDGSQARRRSSSEERLRNNDAAMAERLTSR